MMNQTIENEVILATLGIKVYEKLDSLGIFERMDAAETLSEKVAIAQETEEPTLDVIEKHFRTDDEIISILGYGGLIQKEQVIETIVAHNYTYFELPTPFDYGIGLTDIRTRNGR